MDFAQAEQEFRALDARRQAGMLAESDYTESLAAIRVTDERGRVWMMQERTGSWFVWENGAWQASQPPQAVPSVPPPPPAAATVMPAAPAPAAPSVAATRGVAAAVAPAPPAVAPAKATPVQPVAALDLGTNAGGFIFPLLVWVVAFGGLGFVMLNATADGPDQLPYLGIAAVVVLLLILWRLTRHYEGVIERVRVEQVTDTDDDGTTSSRDVTFAYLRLTNGKTKKVQARRGFAKGDRIVKRKGDWGPRKPKV